MANGYYYLALGLGLFALAMGTLKVAPIEPAHGTQVSFINRIASVFPLKAVGINPTAAMYCAIFAILEISAGSLLAFGRGDWPLVSAICLLVLDVLVVHGHLAIGSVPADMLLPGVLLVLRLVLLFGGMFSGHGKLHLA